MVDNDKSAPALVMRTAALRTLAVLLVLLGAYGIYIVRNILVLIGIALFLAVSLDPPVRWLMRKGMRRPFAVAIVLGLVLLFFAGFIWSIAPPIVDQAGQLFSDLPGHLNRLTERSRAIRRLTDRYSLTDDLTSMLAELPGRLASGAIGSIAGVAGTLASIGTVLVLTIYFMAGMSGIRAGLVRLFPVARRPRIAEVLDVVVDKVGGYMIGNIIISLFAGVGAFVCLELAGVPFALPLALAVAIADLIPMVGATLGAVICVVASLLTVGIWPRTIVVAAFFIAYQQVENYLLAPRVLRNTVNMSSMAVLLVALVGGALLGLAGAIMAIPVAATIKVLLSPRIAAMDGPDEPDEPDGPRTPEEPEPAAT